MLEPTTFCKQYTVVKTDEAVITAGATEFIVVTQIAVVVGNDNTGDVSFRIGFGATVVPAYGNAGILISHPNCPAGGGVSRGIGGDNVIGSGLPGEDLRITCSEPSAAIDLEITYGIVDC
jgi:hypothetical protein